MGDAVVVEFSTGVEAFESVVQFRYEGLELIDGEWAFCVC